MNKIEHKFAAYLNRLVLVFVLALGIGLVSCEDLLSDLESGDARDRLLDTWKVEETISPSKSALDVYWVEISKHPYDTNKIILYNFYNVDADAEGVLSGNTINLPLQDLEGGFEVSGSGVIQGSKANQITWTYTVDDGSGIKENVTAVYSRLTF